MTSVGCLYDNIVVFEDDTLGMVGCNPDKVEGVKNMPELLFATNVGRITSLFVVGFIMPLFPPFRMFVFARIFAARRLFTKGMLQLVDVDWFGT